MAEANSYFQGYDYSRTNNPNRGAFERAVAAIESADHCVAFGSGCAAINACINLLKPGMTLTCISDVYGGTQRLLDGVAHPLMGVKVRYIDFSTIDDKTFEGTDMIWLESPTNPTLTVTDISLVSSLKHSAILVVDNTFSTPINQNPLLLGCDVVVHSVTKYLNGHSDVLMGVAVTSNNDLYAKLRFHQNAVGAVPSPFDCYLALRGLKTLHVRMAAIESNSMVIAKFLESSEFVEKVIYPGLESHPQHLLAKKQMRGFSGIVSFYISGDINASKRFMEALTVFVCGESFGAVESLAECPSLMTHQGVPEDRRRELGISDQLIRLSIGLESVRDLIQDLEGALKKSQEV